jgi:hypothetical protein
VEEAMKFYCTKYWNTKGVIEFEGKVTENEEFASEVSPTSRFDRLFLRIGKDAFVDMCEAEADVERKAHLNMHAKERALQKAKKLLECAVEHSIKVVKR